MRPGMVERAVFEALLPAGPGPKSKGIAETDFARFYEDFFKTAVLPMRVSCAAAVFFAAWVSPLLVGRLPPFLMLSAEDRELALEAMAKSPFYLVRQLLLLLKAMAALCYGADPGVREALGYVKKDDPERKT
ncbi:MAG: hypothetical protein HY927_15340 [Elusimicrobia bacterium]|nr:hypothetical protein [Elusimicrobiota bacterium]